MELRTLIDIKQREVRINPDHVVAVMEGTYGGEPVTVIQLVQGTVMTDEPVEHVATHLTWKNNP